MRILTICPSIRILDAIKMRQSFDLTRSSNTDIIFIKDGTVTEAINTAFRDRPDYDFYHITNDDVKYQTPLWDIKMAQKGKITFGNDRITPQHMPCFPMIDGDIVRALGWLQLPTLTRYCGDTVWRYIGQELKIWEYFEDVKINHLWQGANEEDNLKDMEAFANWLGPQSNKDIEKIRAVLK